MISLSDYNSIISPLVLRGEVVGVLEVFSTELLERHVQLFNDFTNNLTRSIANTILYQEIKRSEEHYKDLFNNAGEGFAVFNSKNKNFINSNKKIFSLTGYSKDELKQLHYLRLFPETERKKIEALVKDHLRTNPHKYYPVKDYETTLLTKNGKAKYVSITINQTADENEWFFIINDITDRKQTEEALYESENRFRQFFENKLEYSYITSPKGIILDANKAALRALGYRKEEMVGQHLRIIYSPEVHTKMKRLFIQWDKTGKIEDEEMVIVSKSGEKRTVLLGAEAVKDRQGKAVHLVSVQKDITARKRAEEEVKHSSEVQSVLNKLLSITFEDIPLEKILKKYIDMLLAVPWIKLQSRGGIWLVSENPGKLKLIAQSGLSEEVKTMCSTVPFGKCLCGRAAKSGKIEFSNNVSKNHLSYKGMAPHGHYCVPIKIGNQVAGIMNFYLKADHQHNQREEDFLNSVSKVLANIIEKKRAKEALLRSEEKYRKLVANANDGVAIINTEGYVIFTNDAFHKIIGFNKNELAELHFSKLLHPVDHNLVIKRFKDRLSGKNVKSTYEFKIINKAGEVRHVSYSGGLIKESNNIIGVQAIIRDITKTKALQENIEWTKNHYEQVIDAIEDSICVIDINYNIISFNLKFASKVNLPLKQLKNRNYREVISRFENKVLKNFFCDSCEKDCIIDTAFALGKTMTEEIASQKKDDQQLYHRISIFPTKDEKNEVYQMVITICDITERRTAEEEIKRLNDFNQRIIDTSPVSIIVLNKDGVIIAANKQANQLMAKSDKKVVGRELTDTREIKKNKSLMAKYGHLLKKGEPFYFDNLFYTSELTGERKYLNIIAVPLFDNNSNIEGAISMALDNTEAMAAKQKLEDLNRNLERKVAGRTRELDIINRKLSEVLDLKSKFIADASHELRTPLTVIQGNLDLAIKEAQRAACEPPEIYSLALSEVERMSMILTDLTMLTNLDSSSEVLMYEKVNLGQLIKAAGQSLKVLADQKRIALIYKKGARKVEVIGDESKLEKLLLNIVRNGIKYTEPKGRVKIYVEVDDYESRIVVEDNGIGIPEPELNHIFERFYRVDKARSRNEGGTGLGLAIAKWIVDAHKGKISVESKLGQGSKFTIHLPYDCRKQGIPTSLFN